MNFGVLPLQFENNDDYERIDQGDRLRIADLHSTLPETRTLSIENTTKGESYPVIHELSDRQVQVLFDGGLINFQKNKM